MDGTIKDERDHAERRSVDEAGREEEHEECAEEEREVMRLNAHDGDDARDKHKQQGVEGDL